MSSVACTCWVPTVAPTRPLINVGDVGVPVMLHAEPGRLISGACTPSGTPDAPVNRSRTIRSGGTFVSNVQTGPTVVPAALRAVTRQKYVVLIAVVGEYVADVSPATSGGGGLAVPNARS